MNKLIWPAMLMLFILVSCNPPTKEQGSQGDLPSSDTYSLENCETNIADNVPDFYKNYFTCVSIEMSSDGESVNISFNGLPPYESWYWQSSHPNYVQFNSQGSGYYQNPGNILEFDTYVSIPLNPEPRSLAINSSLVDGVVGSSSYEYSMGSVGSALNGVHMFNPLAGPGDVIEDEVYSFDEYSGHPTNTGEYHYHTSSVGPLEVLGSKGLVTNTTPGSAEIEMYGVMCDGVPVLGCTELDGSRPDGSEWDAQNGHVHDILDGDGNVLLSNRYHTHVCYFPDRIDNVSSIGHYFNPEISYYKSSGGSNDACKSINNSAN